MSLAHRPNASPDGLYRDLPLDPARKEIRVLTLLPSDGDAPLGCTLKTISLGDESIPFYALSYVWGDPTDTTIINVNNVYVPVTKSLAGALASLQNRLAPRLSKQSIWADAICINQQDIAERTQQVQLMADIYSTARHVVVWLGDGNRHTDLAIRMMGSPGFCAGLDDGRIPTHDEIKADVVFKHDLCKRQWWQRLWVRQEFVLATRYPYFGCGSSFVAWPDLLNCFTSLPRSWDYPELQSLWAECRREVTGSEDDVPATTGIHLMSLDQIYEHFHRDGALSLPYAVRYVLRNSRATNALDFIYGLLGLLQDSDRDRIILDYEMEPMELFQQVSNILWREHYGLMLGDLLPSLEFRPDERNYPSWVPDFAAQPVRGWTDHRSLRAKGLLTWAKEVRAPLVAEPSLLFEGIRFDVIRTTIATPKDFNDIEELVPILVTVEKAILEGITLDLSLSHQLKPLESMKRREIVVHTLTRSMVEYDEPLFPGLDDETVWRIFLQRNAMPSLVLDSRTSYASHRKRILTRFTKALRAKFLDRQVLITEAGFVGIGVRQIEEGDVITFPFGGNAPLVLRSRGSGWAIVGCAYVSGLMEPERLHVYIENGVLTPVEFRIY